MPAGRNSALVNSALLVFGSSDVGLACAVGGLAPGFPCASVFADRGMTA